MKNKNNIGIRLFLAASTIFITLITSAQDNIYPAKIQDSSVIIKNGKIHVGNGEVIENGYILFKNGKIETVSKTVPDTAGAVVIDATGKEVYPGLILPNSDLGLKEIGSGVRGSNDYRELGEYNSNIKSIVAYDATSAIINTLRSNGILLANIVPQGSLLTGTSSTVQLDAWNWEDALYVSNTGIHLNLPMLLQLPRRSFSRSAGNDNPVELGLKTVNAVKSFFKEAKAYLQSDTRKETNLKFEALKPLFEKKEKLFIHADLVRQMLVAVDFAKTFDIDVVIVGGSDSYYIADLLKQNNIAVILNTLHELPTLEDDDVDQPFKTPAALQKAGVLFALNNDHAESRYRNLPFDAGTAAAYGLTREQALQAITLSAAKILGIDHQTGSIESGKDANIIITQGDLLDMEQSVVTDAYIQGRKINLQNKQTQLYDRYRHKYNLP